MFANNFPDYYETFRPKLDGPFVPAIQNEKKEYVANEAYKDVPGAVLRTGNIPKDGDTGVHAVDDVVLQATGPGSEGVQGLYGRERRLSRPRRCHGARRQADQLIAFATLFRADCYSPPESCSRLSRGIAIVSAGNAMVRFIRRQPPRPCCR